MDLILLRPDERALVHVGVDFNVGVIAELQRVLFRGVEEMGVSYTFIACLLGATVSTRR
jgi:hypothetical protein